MSKLALGTVQFGLNYGIANKFGKIQIQQAKKIISAAEKNAFSLIDTASFYGKSEKILGQIGVSNFKIVSKLPHLPSNCLDVSLWVQEHVKRTLKNLGINSLYGILLHKPHNLSDALGIELSKALYEIKNKGLVKKIGVSIYEPSELDTVIRLLKIDIVQSPLNLIDRRLETSGWLTKLYDMNIEIHTRSTFLQGLLLMSRNKIPKKFEKWSHIWNTWHQKLREKNLSAIAVCLAYPLSLKEVRHVIVGVDNKEQINKIIHESKNKINKKIWSFMNSDDQDLINPTKWVNLF